MNKLTEIIVIVSCVITWGIIIYAVALYYKKSYKAYTEKLQHELSSTRTTLANVSSIKLSFDECNKIIDYIIDDIWKNKYFISYRLREISIIPSMDDEITLFVNEVLESISNDVMSEALKYYSNEYLIKKITRTAQMLFIEYTNTYKPNTK